MDLTELQATLRRIAATIGPKAEINVVLLNGADRDAVAVARINPTGGVCNETAVHGATWRLLLHGIEVEVEKIAAQRMAPDREYESWFEPELPLAIAAE
jgi:hypothetical protein